MNSKIEYICPNCKNKLILNNSFNNTEFGTIKCSNENCNYKDTIV